ncbi:MAG: GDP-mannose 4,6-dehydratase [Planctomycetota bacterium]
MTSSSTDTSTPPPANGKRALITGITGQDGSYLAEYLLSLGYQVHGIIRRASSFNTQRLEHLYQDPHGSDVRLFLHHGDLTDSSSLARIVELARPDEVYNLAAQSHVRVSFDLPVHTADAAALGAVRLLETVREFRDGTGSDVRYYQASSSEMYGRVMETPQTERTPFRPRSPYACAKVFAHFQTINYREAYGLHASCGILFNHESPRRGETFVTRKITRAVGRIKAGLQHKVYLGNLDAERDWGFAGDYVRAMHAMLAQPTGDDYVVATGARTSVREFAQLAFEHAGLKAEDHVEFDARYLRPAEVDLLQGDASKARAELGWSPTVDVRALAAMMVDHDSELARREVTLRRAGHAMPDHPGEQD